MKITAQLSGVKRPLSVELRLINFCSCDFDSQEEHDTSSTRGLLTNRSDFPGAEGLVRCSPFGGVEFGSQDAIVGSLKRKGTMEQKLQIEPIRRNLYLSNLVGAKRSEDRVVVRFENVCVIQLQLKFNNSVARVKKISNSVSVRPGRVFRLLSD
jgi:hypothetical protein